MEPVSKRAPSDFAFTFTVVKGREGVVAIKQPESMAQKLITACGRKVELGIFFRFSFPRSSVVQGPQGLGVPLLLRICRGLLLLPVRIELWWAS